LSQQPEPLAPDLESGVGTDTGDVAARMRKARHDAECDWIRGESNDRDRGGRRLEILHKGIRDREDHIRAIRALIIRYGTPSEDLGRGPSFRLRPVVRD
jgi:hypothetical protein